MPRLAPLRQRPSTAAGGSGRQRAKAGGRERQRDRQRAKAGGRERQRDRQRPACAGLRCLSSVSTTVGAGGGDPAPAAEHTGRLGSRAAAPNAVQPLP